jgi:hypothetical protein
LKRLFNILRCFFIWNKQERSFRAFLRKIKNLEQNSCENEIIIVIQQWTFTPLPWYLISLGIAFHLYGKRVRFIFDDTKLGISYSEEKFLNNSILRVLKRVPLSIPFQKLSSFNETEAYVDQTFEFEQLVRKNITIHHRGEVFPLVSEEIANSIRQAFKETAMQVHQVINEVRPEYLVIGGGGFSTSGVWLEMAKASGIRAATIDSGHSILLLSTDGIAANLEDIPRAFSMIKKEDEERAISEAKNELNRRMSGTDQFTSQILPSKGRKYSFGIVLPLNQSYDLSALERHYVFGSQTEWILETIDWVLQNSDESIAIRRHPIERFPIYKSNDDYLKSISDRFGKNERIRFVDSDEDINTYDLIENAKVVVPYISTVGTEGAALGKIVVSEGASCYANLGFTWSAKTKEQYFDFLRQAIDGELILSLEQQNAAWKCYYLTQCCNWHHTVFTPQPADFENWVIQDPEVILLEKSTRDVLYAIDNNIPISIIIHENSMKSAPFEG